MQTIHNTAALRALAQAGTSLTTSPTPASCSCRLAGFTGWSSITEERWPTAQMQAVANLRDAHQPEPSFAEYHPGGTRYDSPEAPMALGWFPLNRCGVWRCQACGLQVLRYTEFGGYYVDHRVRVLQPQWVVDAPPAPD